jgi:hypothetical protein
MSQLQADQRPTVSPENDETQFNDPVFVSECMQLIAADAEKFGWQFGQSLLTQSYEWGLIWRTGFRLRAQVAGGPRVNRIICWRQSGADGIGIAFAFGQRGEPLK